MASEQEFTMLNIYHDLMVEAKARMLSINALTNDQRGIPSPLVYEYGVLQIRMSCEIIGLACLIAHGDLVSQAKADLRKTYAPGQILAELGQMHDDFYPVPMRPEKTANGWHFAEYNGGPYLAKSEVAGIWARCGDVLHRGHVKKLLKAKNPVQKNFLDLQEWGQKIINLLNNHRIVTFDRRLAFICMLEDGNGDVKVALGEAPSPEQADLGLRGDAA